MSSVGVSAPVDVATAFDALDAAVAAVNSLDLADLPVAVRLRALERREIARRALLAGGGDTIAALAAEDPAATGGPVYKAIADVCRLSYPEARRRVHAAEDLTVRLSLTGAPIPPVLPATAQAWNEGLLDPEHLRVIQKFVHDLPSGIATDLVDHAEQFLAGNAVELRPDQLAKVADRLAIVINPGGNFSDADRARQRGFTWSAQRHDGMSIGTLCADPALRAYLDAWFAKFAAPGMCNAEDSTPCVKGQPAEETTQRDTRSHAQRQHDALCALVRGQLGDPKLGRHRGLPVTVVVSTTLDQLMQGAGQAVTGGGTLLPIRDLIRMAAHAYHYLTVFDTHTRRPLYLGRAKRIATADQRIVLYTKDRGCTRPGCDVPADWCEVHHTTPWAAGGTTDITELALGCPADHKLTELGWRTTKLANGDTQWIPPPQLGLPGGTNSYHYPEKFLSPHEEKSDDAAG